MARQGYPSDKQDQFVLRLPDGMRDRIKTIAEENGRSMNAEIVARLSTSLDPSARESEAERRLQNIRDIIRKHEEEIRRMYDKSNNPADDR